MSVLDRPLTYDDLRQMPNDGQRYEIIDGALFMAPSPSFRHQELSGLFFEDLTGFVRPRELGKVFYAPADVRLSPHDVVQPDLFFVRRERLHLIHDHVCDGAPDLVVEILSPSTRVYDEVRKADLYASAGVPELWFADPEGRDIRAYVLVENRYESIPVEGTFIRSVILPGFVIDVVGVFTRLG